MQGAFIVTSQVGSRGKPSRWYCVTRLCKQDGVLVFSEIGQGPEAHDALAQSSGRSILCRTCGTGLAVSTDATTVNGHHRHSFINPVGYIYRIRCFTAVRNVTTVGMPSSEFTWFAGYTWLALSCATCGCHVGWQFDAEHSRFYAVIADRIVESDERKH